MKVRLLIFLTSLVSLTSFGQTPIINSVQPISTYPGNMVLITGSGFSSDPTKLRVSFDQIIVTPSASSDFSIEVILPAQARLSNIEVTNLVSGLSAKTNFKFLPFFSGKSSDFNSTNFATPVAGVSSFPSGSTSVNDLCTCDLDVDGKPDMAATQSFGNSLMLFRNTSTTPGSISFLQLASLSLTTPTNNTACGDLDGDGKPEILVSRDGTRNEVWIFKNNSTSGTITMAAATASTKLFLDPGQNSFRMVIRDLNADGKPEVIVSNAATTNSIYIFVNQSNPGVIAFNATPTKLLVTGANTTYGIDAQDLDGDGKPEIIVNQFNNPNLFVFKNASAAGTISFPVVTKIDLVGSLNHLTTGDFNKDGKLDIAVTSNTSQKQVFVLLNQSTSSAISFGAPITLLAGDSPWGIDISDIDGDGDADIIVANIINTFTGAETKEIVVFLNDGSASFTRKSILTGKRSKNLKVGDLDGDGKPDIAYTTITDNATTDRNNSIDILRNKNCFVPVITNPLPLTICSDQSIRLNSIPSPGVTFAWKESSNPAFKTSTDAFADTPLGATGSYSVTATSEGGACSVQSAIINVTSSLGSVPANPTIDPVAPVCLGQTLQLSTPTVAGATYIWTGPNSFSSAMQNPTIANVTEAIAGIYALQLQVSNGTCKSNTTTIRVDVANLANFFISSSVASNTVCQGSSLNLNVNTASGHTYQWIKDGFDISLQTSNALSVNQQGVYKVKVTNTSLGCSIETSAVTVSVFTMPVSAFTLSTNSTCVNQSVTFTSQSTFDSRATVAYAWDFGDGTNSALQSPTKSYATPGTRNIQLTVSYTGVTGCSNVSTKSIAVATAQTPVITATVNTICAGEPSLLSVTGTFSAYAWTGPSTGASSTLNITQPGTYIVNTTETNGCTATAQIIIGAKALVTLSVTADGKPVASGADVLVLSGVPVQLVASGAVTYSWAPPDGLDNPSIANPKATPLTETTYTVTGVKVGSCNGIHSFNVKFDPAGNTFNPPNAFSPNGDTNNDFWVIQGSQNYMDCTISIFNKQGSNVFEQKGYTNNWDGTFEGKQLPQGTYYYVLTCPDEKPITGHILLAR